MFVETPRAEPVGMPFAGRGSQVPATTFWPAFRALVSAVRLLVAMLEDARPVNARSGSALFPLPMDVMLMPRLSRYAAAPTSPRTPLLVRIEVGVRRDPVAVERDQLRRPVHPAGRTAPPRRGSRSPCGRPR